MILYFYILAIAGCGYAIWRGSRSERTAAIVYISGAVITTLIGTRSEWLDFEPRVFAIDMCVLIGFWSIALKSRSFWPYWITGWQLVGILVHIQKAFLPGIGPAPYGYLSMALSFPILLLIVLASVRGRHQQLG